MSCSGIDITNPYSWIVFSGLLAGVAVTALLKGKNRRWALFSFFLSGSVLFALLALFLPGPDRFLDWGLLFFFTGSVFFGCCATWFWRSFGLAFFILASLSIIFIPLALRPWRCAEETVEIGRFRVLSSVDGETTLDVTGQGQGESSYQSMEGESFSIELHIMETEDYYFVVRARRMYRIISSLQFQETDSAWEVSQDFFQRLPGIAYSTIRSVPFIPEPFTTYIVKLVFEEGEPGIQVDRLYL